VSGVSTVQTSPTAGVAGAFGTAQLDVPRFLPGTPDHAVLLERLDRCRRLFVSRIARDRVLAGAGPPLAVLVGGTNVGKSTIFNALCADDVSAVSPLARGTKWPVLYAPATAQAAWEVAGALGRYVPIASADAKAALVEAGERREVLVRWHDTPALAELGLVDTPDIDSAFERNRQVAEDWCFASDVLAFVASAEKYHDEVGVLFLAEAVRLGKRVVVLANKFDDAEALGDLRSRMLAKAGAPADTVVVAIPPLPVAERAGGDWVTPVGQAIRAAATPEARRAASLAAVRVFREEFGALLEASAAQAAAVQSLREAATGLAATEATHWRTVLESGRFFELERVYRDVLAELRVPVLDEVYSAIGRLWNGVRRLLPGQVEDPFARKIAERRAHERDGAKAAARKAFDGREALAERFGASLGAAAATLVPATPGADAISRAIDAFLDAQEQAADAWVAERRAEILQRLRAHPNLTRVLRILRSVLQLGPGVLAVWLTGGFGADLVSFTVSERAMKMLLEALGGRMYLQGLRTDYLDQRTSAFRAFLVEQVATPVAAGVPALPSAEAIAGARAALADLEAL